MKITVTLDGREERFFPGATVRDLLGRLSPAQRAAFRAGLLFIADDEGHRLGEGGALEDGERYLVCPVNREMDQ